MSKDNVKSNGDRAPRQNYEKFGGDRTVRDGMKVRETPGVADAFRHGNVKSPESEHYDNRCCYRAGRARLGASAQWAKRLGGIRRPPARWHC